MLQLKRQASEPRAVVSGPSGAVAVYGPQKGLPKGAAIALEEGLTRLCTMLLPSVPTGEDCHRLAQLWKAAPFWCDVASLPGSGAGTGVD